MLRKCERHDPWPKAGPSSGGINNTYVKIVESRCRFSSSAELNQGLVSSFSTPMYFELTWGWSKSVVGRVLTKKSRFYFQRWMTEATRWVSAFLSDKRSQNTLLFWAISIRGSLMTQVNLYYYYLNKGKATWVYSSGVRGHGVVITMLKSPLSRMIAGFLLAFAHSLSR